MILGSGLLAMAMGFFFMYIMKLCAGCIVWTILFIMLVLSTALTYFMMGMSTTKQSELDATYAIDYSNDPATAKKGLNI